MNFNIVGILVMIYRHVDFFVSSEFVVNGAGCGRRESVRCGLSLEIGNSLGGMKSGGQRDWAGGQRDWAGVQDVLSVLNRECESIYSWMERLYMS